MFENKLRSFSRKFGEKDLNDFYVLTRKRHRREIYFKGNSTAISFMKGKFNSPYKKLIYFIIKVGLMRFFLKKIKLSSKMGDLIYVAEQIKAFNLKEKKVISLPFEESESDFINSKEFQKEMGEKGFAPRMTSLNRDIPYSSEVLLEEYKESNSILVFKKLISYYDLVGVRRISFRKYVKDLRFKIKSKGIENNLLDSLLEDIYNENGSLLLTKVHGDFGKEHILKNGHNIFFVDWSQREALIINDLVKFFRGNKYFFKTKEFNRLIKLFPKEVSSNLRTYLLLNEIENMAYKKKFLKESFDKIKIIKNVL